MLFNTRDYEMCEKCVLGFPEWMQKMMNKKVSGVREYAMKNDKDLRPEIFDENPSDWFDKMESGITKETIGDGKR